MATSFELMAVQLAQGLQQQDRNKASKRGDAAAQKPAPSNEPEPAAVFFGPVTTGGVLFNAEQRESLAAVVRDHRALHTALSGDAAAQATSAFLDDVVRLVGTLGKSPSQQSADEAEFLAPLTVAERLKNLRDSMAVFLNEVDSDLWEGSELVPLSLVKAAAAGTVRLTKIRASDSVATQAASIDSAAWLMMDGVTLCDDEERRREAHVRGDTAPIASSDMPSIERARLVALVKRLMADADRALQRIPVGAHMRPTRFVTRQVALNVSRLWARHFQTAPTVGFLMDFLEVLGKAWGVRFTKPDSEVAARESLASTAER